MWTLFEENIQDPFKNPHRMRWYRGRSQMQKLLGGLVDLQAFNTQSRPRLRL